MVYSPMMDGVTMRKRARSAGVTMVELMIALIIMAIAMLGVVSVMLHTIRGKEITREYDIAKEAAATKLERMRALTWDDPGDGSPGPFLSDTSSSNTLYQPWSIPELNHSISRNT